MNNLIKSFSVSINNEEDIIISRQRVRDLAKEIGFSQIDITLIATAVSEIARNIVKYAKNGKIEFLTIIKENIKGLEIKAVDNGPGIENISFAMEDGYSTGGGLGLGLPGAKRIMDEFTINSEIGIGTKIDMIKWLVS